MFDHKWQSLANNNNNKCDLTLMKIFELTLHKDNPLF